MQEHIRNAPTDRRCITMLNNRTWWASAHNYATQLLNNSTYTRLTSPLTTDVNLQHTAYQTFYGKRNHVVDLDTFHRFGERCSVYDLRRDAKIGSGTYGVCVCGARNWPKLAIS